MRLLSCEKWFHIFLPVNYPGFAFGQDLVAQFVAEVVGISFCCFVLVGVKSKIKAQFL